MPVDVTVNSYLEAPSIIQKSHPPINLLESVKLENNSMLRGGRKRKKGEERRGKKKKNLRFTVRSPQLPKVNYY